MGMKLKSGADLCGFELSRFCVQNDVAIPDAPASGRKYFHTGTGMEGKYSLLGRERIYTGTAWRSAAYVDDLANLDLATKEDYLALKEKVELHSGEVDTDAIINNMKEVTAFLSGFAEDANLMSVLDGKLDKTGGAINVKTDEGISINRTNGTRAELAFKVDGGYKGGLGIDTDGIPFYRTFIGGIHTLLHSGIVGDYALKIDGSNKMTADNGIRWLNETDFDTLRTGLRTYMSNNGTSVDGVFPSTNYGTVLHVGISVPNYAFQLASSVNTDGLFYRGYYASANRWSDWKTIAFTDSNVASAQALVHSNGTIGAVVNSYGDTTFASDVYIANGKSLILAKDAEGIYVGNDGVFWHNAANTWTKTLMVFNENGNVLIGTTEDNGAKLQVNGNAKIEVGNRLHIFMDNAFASYDKTIGGFYMYGGIREGEALSCEVAGVGGSWVGAGFKLMQNGNFGIGLTPSAQLHVNKDIVANGTIACKGVAAEGSAPVGTVDKWAGSIAIGTKSQSYTHGLGTTDITVAIYEKNGNEWVQILTDVDIVNANTIRVTFGANTTVEHRIVVMG